MEKIKRNLNIDLIKSIAILFVLTIHNGDYSYPIGSRVWVENIFFRSIASPAVPLFFMCTGVLFLSVKRDKDMINYIFKEKKLLGIIIPMIFWGFMYKLFFLNKYASITWKGAIQAFKEVLLFNQETHLYYLQITILIYLAMPILSAFVQNLDREILEYTLLIWFMLGILYPMIGECWPFYLISSIGRQFMINMAYSSIGYCLLGYYLKEYPLQKSSRFIFMFSGLAIVFFGTMISSINMGELNTLFFEGMSVGVCFYALGLFSLLIHSEGGNFSDLQLFYLMPPTAFI